MNPVSHSIPGTDFLSLSLSLFLSLSLSDSLFRFLLFTLVMHTVAAPSRHISPVRGSRPSPLNPTRPRAAAAPVLTRPPPSTAANSKTHLANLDRLLQKPSPAPAPSLPPLPQGHGGWADMDVGHRWDALNALNLSGVLPAARRVEEMSPRSLNHLQRLLIGTPRPSPRSGIAGRWRELHGARDWEGLLDPLDEDLRREIVRNGDFVQTAYHAFHSNPAKKPSERRQVALPDRSYHVTRNLYATSSIEMPRLLDGVAPWMRQRTSWVGYVAVCDSEREIQRMGRRDIVIALRGTATGLEWAENFRAALVKVTNADDAGPTAPEAPADGRESQSEEEQVEPKVECGFWSLFTTASKQERSLRDTVVEEVRRLMEVYKGEQLSITVTGHSLGAALAVLVADELGASLGPGNSPPIAVFSFGSPHVGNRGFAERLRDRGVKVLRVVNKRDVITRVPGVFADYKKVEEEAGGGEARQRWLRAAAEGGKLGRLPDRWRDAVERAMTAWSYTHVGSELRLDSRQSPFLKPDAGPGCCHDLEAYLHLVDGFLSSHCPFRANAKRSIVKLLAHEGSGLKRHYTSRALALIGIEVAAAADAQAVMAADGGGRGCVPSPTSS